MQSHDPLLSVEERKDALHFKTCRSREKKKAAWEALVPKYGAYRAAWIVQIPKEELNRQEAGNDQNSSGEPKFLFKWLPERLVFYLYKKVETAPIRDRNNNLPIGGKIPDAGLTILGEGDDWMYDCLFRNV